MPPPAARALLRSSLLLTMCAAAAAAPHALAASAPARCASSSLTVVVPQSEGTATQAVAFLSVRNRGASCRLVAAASLTVLRNGAAVKSIRGNPVSYRIDQTVAHGTTMLFDAWWGNWCARAAGGFRVRDSIGRLTATAAYRILPSCIAASRPSVLRGVRSPG